MTPGSYGTASGPAPVALVLHARGELEMAATFGVSWPTLQRANDQRTILHSDHGAEFFSAIKHWVLHTGGGAICRGDE